MANIEGRIDRTITRLEDQLELWGARLKEAIAKGEVAGQEAKIGSRKQTDELKAKIDAAQAKLQALKAAGSDKWDTFKADIDSSWKELEDAFKKLTH